MSLRVLLADDHAVMRDGLQALLQAAGAEVVAAVANGRDAVRRALELRPDVLVLDIAMPELNGIEALRLVRAKWPEARVVVLSMHADAEHVYRALDAGAAGYILKESAGPEVVAAVRAVHVGKRYLSPAIAPLADRARPRAGPSPLESLSTRERQVLQLVVEGRSSAEIAQRVHLSPKTVETYRSRLMKKLGVGDTPALVKFAVQHGITSL
ncbi:MAG TPA: response regulator transcription factor [Burkholderiaceae bacterium]|nr:response regulator transcription factor [Burkholderiaceae bacterium]